MATILNLVGPAFKLNMEISVDKPTTEVVSEILKNAFAAILDNFGDLIGDKEIVITCEKQQAALFHAIDKRNHSVVFQTTLDDRIRNTFVFGLRDK